MRERSVQRFETVYLPRDGREILRILSDPAVAGYRVWQNYRIAAEFHEGRWTGGGTRALRRKLQGTGVDPDLPMDVEVFLDGAPADGGEAPFSRPDGGMMRPAGLFKSRTVFLCLNGPSFDEGTRAMLAERPGIVTFCVNNGGHGFRPDLWTCVDAPERFMDSIWLDGRIVKFVPVKFFKRPIYRDAATPVVGDCPNVWGYRRNEHFRAADFLSERTFNWGNHRDYGGGRSVMLVALRIAWELGFRRVVLSGCDWEMSTAKEYWFAQSRSRQAIRNNLSTFAKMDGYFAELSPLFAKAGFEIVNATPDSKLAAFPRVDLADELERAVVDTDATTAGMYDAVK